MRGSRAWLNTSDARNCHVLQLARDAATAAVEAADGDHAITTTPLLTRIGWSLKQRGCRNVWIRSSIPSPGEHVLSHTFLVVAGEGGRAAGGGWRRLGAASAAGQLNCLTSLTCGLPAMARP